MAWKWGLGSGIAAGSWAPPSISVHPAHGTTLPRPHSIPPNFPPPRKPPCWPNLASMGQLTCHHILSCLGQCCCLCWPSMPCADTSMPYGTFATVQGQCEWLMLAQGGIGLRYSSKVVCVGLHDWNRFLFLSQIYIFCIQNTLGFFSQNQTRHMHNCVSSFRCL